jgi:GT2 family glycosyltransferase
VGGVAGQMFRHLPRENPGYMNRAAIAQDFTVVTAACMMIPRRVWDTVGGLDEGYAVAFNDVDLCMRIRKAGWLIAWTPWAALYHYEYKSRGAEDTPEKRWRYLSEILRFKQTWEDEINAGDPCYNPNLSPVREDFSSRYE